MNTKTFLVAGFIGGIVNWFLGWLCYGIILVDYFPNRTDSTLTITYVFLGFASIGFFLSYFFNRWAHISTVTEGAKAGASFGLFIALFNGFFNLAMEATAIEPIVTPALFALDLVISIGMTTITGAVIGGINSKIS